MIDTCTHSLLLEPWKSIHQGNKGVPAILFYKLNCKSRINISLCLLNILYRWLKVYKIDLSKFTTMFKTYQRKNRKERQYNLFWELTDSIFYLFILYLLSNKLARYHNADHSFALTRCSRILKNLWYNVIMNISDLRLWLGHDILVF